jgi:nitrogen regulatory protein P-II 1
MTPLGRAIGQLLTVGFDGPVLPDDLADKAVEAVVKAAATGKFGDGKVFVSTLTDVVRIRTGERGEAAL